ncbi:glycosyltransferase family 4 protein [Lacinutrix sp. C3R15]|uniref:glycosyltransferase family 4 protein n=1 Tax=Flavobacteriaceae TaxID=49546 RepID=UPI001C081C3E|nr:MULTISPECIES: glycosyltransferase family 4 protein [Flavobacteriaceae]MBU2939566.1 glycosyltransferase family 4 protein [Lacinutrix sp. C3R15]MDO6622880.1 glycosyltransferase family 4 protein [Oceanihabitans sp. 1_MG-2023]
MKIFHIFPTFSNKYQPYNKRLITSLEQCKELEVFVVSLNEAISASPKKDIICLKQDRKIQKLKAFFIGVLLYLKNEKFTFSFSKISKSAKLYGKYAFIFKNKDAVFHFHDLHAIDQVLLPILIQKKIKYVVSLRGNDIAIKPLLSEAIKAHAIMVLKHAWRIHSVCQSLKEEAITLATINADKIHVIYRTPNLKDIIQSKEVTVIQKEINIVTISRVHWKKCIPESLIAVKNLVNSGYDVRYHIIGGFPKQGEYDKIVYLIKKLGLTKNVCIHGYLNESEYKRILLDMHIFWLPSINEGIPNTLYLALKCGFPVVACDTDGIPEIVKDRHNGLLFSPYDFNALAEKTKSVIDNADLRLKLQKNAMETVLQTQENETSQYVSLYCSH